jgi:Ribbon-helix-helix protein, copG family
MTTTDTKRARASRANGAKGGKPSKGATPCKKTSITLAPDILQRLDKAAEGSSRSDIIEKALIAYLPPLDLYDIVKADLD